MCAERRKRYSKVRTDREIVKRENIDFARRKRYGEMRLYKEEEIQYML
jgi:hypothetical protein